MRIPITETESSIRKAVAAADSKMFESYMRATEACGRCGATHQFTFYEVHTLGLGYGCFKCDDHERDGGS